MSRQFLHQQRPRVPPMPDNPYQGTTTSTLPLPHSYKLQPPKDTNYHLKCTGSIRGAPCPLEHDACFTDEPFGEHSYYDYYDHDHGYQTSPNRHKIPSRNEFTYSDDSGSTRLQHYDYDEISNRRYSRNNYSSERSQKVSIAPTKDPRRVYPSECDRVGPEPMCLEPPPTSNYQRRISERSPSSLSSGVPSAVVYGCGGKCQTFENVCYYFLQVAFTMGILIGISLSIAGWVLRKSAARNLQVLLYIGTMLSLVCALLLGIQCNARSTARMRQKALRNAKRAPIQMDLLQANAVQQQPLMDNGTIQRGLPVTLVPVQGPGPVLQMQRSYDRRQHHAVDQQGVPWWRRKDLQ